MLLVACASFIMISCQSAPSQSPPTQSGPTEVTINEAVQSTSAIQKWEYKTLRVEEYAFGPFGSTEIACDRGTCFGEDANNDTAQKLNALGAEGWELVGIAHNPAEIGAILIFKRPLK
ncbi:MAG: DUF4177 domain-containing protein [Anaerolineales bacterium]